MQVVQRIQELSQRIHAADDETPDPLEPAKHRVPIRFLHGEPLALPRQAGRRSIRRTQRIGPA
jgi:hypothetical protein